MKNEFLESYEALFDDSYVKLYRTLRVKLKAMKHCQDVLDKEVKQAIARQLQQKFSKFNIMAKNNKFE